MEGRRQRGLKHRGYRRVRGGAFGAQSEGGGGDGDHPDRGRHAATQLRADRATRQLPIILVSVTGEERSKSDKAVTGPTRRYTLGLDAPSVLNAIVVDL